MNVVLEPDRGRHRRLHGPYNQVHSGLPDRLSTSYMFQAVGGKTYYVIMKAIDVAGNESAPSPEIAVTVP